MVPSLHKLTVLVAEDTIPMRDLIVDILASWDISVIYGATNGEDGFSSFVRFSPDIVITDWLMPKCDGIGLTRAIRTDGLSPNRMVPIILMTGFSALSRVAAARDAGVTEFLVKPFSANDLARRINAVINSPRDFIDAPGFFGPDRRRRVVPGYAGPLRRTDDRLST